MTSAEMKLETGLSRLGKCNERLYSRVPGWSVVPWSAHILMLHFTYNISHITRQVYILYPLSHDSAYVLCIIPNTIYTQHCILDLDVLYLILYALPHV